MLEHLPVNIKGTSIMFKNSLNMNEINKAIDDNLSIIYYQFDVSTSEILNIYIGLGESYTPLNISNNFKFELEKKNNQSIKINYEFYDFKSLEKENKIIQKCSNKKEYYLSSLKHLCGPWPKYCKKINSEYNISDFSKALAMSTSAIQKDRENIVVEIRSDFNLRGFPIRFTYGN